MKHFLLYFLLISSGALFAQQTFTYTGAMDSIQIPNCVDSILIEVYGAQGSDAPSGGTGGLGGYASGYLSVSQGDWIYINVGGQDGYNGGGAGGANGFTDFSGTVHPDSGGYGGGASDVRFGGKALADRVIVGGGGGGGGHRGVWPGCQPATPAGNGGIGGDAGNGTVGTSTACNCTGGGGLGGDGAVGSTAGNGAGYNTGGCGTAGTGYNAPGGNGALGVGGDGSINFYNGTGGGGGGGGGYYGGGAGGSGWDTTPGGGGGGGSSYTGGVTSDSTDHGVRTGDGEVIITLIGSSPILDTNVVVTGFTLYAVDQSGSGVTYQWLDCDNSYSAISGATNPSYTATSNGDYAVLLDNGNGCVDTTSCHTIAGVGIDEKIISEFKTYPNPINDILTVDLEKEIGQYTLTIKDMNGRKVYAEQSAQVKFNIDMSKFESGMYILEVNGDQFNGIKQIVKN